MKSLLEASRYIVENRNCPVAHAKSKFIPGTVNDKKVVVRKDNVRQSSLVISTIEQKAADICSIARNLELSSDMTPLELEHAKYSLNMSLNNLEDAMGGILHQYRKRW
jgi:hypothetical protein